MLTAVETVIMVIDAGKGVEARTRKLLEICRIRGIPIFTFVNKMDRPARPTVELMNELELLDAAGAIFDEDSIRDGRLTPVFWRSVRFDRESAGGRASFFRHRGVEETEATEPARIRILEDGLIPMVKSSVSS